MNYHGESESSVVRRRFGMWISSMVVLALTSTACADRGESPEISLASGRPSEVAADQGEQEQLSAAIEADFGRSLTTAGAQQPEDASQRPALLRDGARDPRVREALEEARKTREGILAEGPGGERMQRMRILMRGEDDEARLALAHEILASDERGPLTLHALQALADLDPEAAADEMNRRIDQAGDDPRARGLLASAIGMIGRNDKALSGEDLTSFFERGADDVQLAAARALQGRGDASLMQRYEAEAAQDLSNPDARTRADAVRKLGSTRSPSAKELLLPLLADTDESVRLQTLGALRQLGGDAELLERIKVLESDESARVRQRATRIVESMERRLSLGR